jgi:Na+/glutamate symporter
MLGPFDWYSAIEIGIAAATVGIVVLIGWLQGPPRA